MTRRKTRLIRGKTNLKKNRCTKKTRKQRKMKGG
jgi:hypothetical protein